MTTGKLDPDALRASVLPYRGSFDPRIQMGGAIGGDGAVIEKGNDFLALVADPITGTSSSLGKFLVDINANDVAVLGARPRWLTVTLLVPAEGTEEEIEKIMSSADREAKSLDIAIVGGHTERVQNLPKPLLSGCMLGEGDKFLDPERVSEGDFLYLAGSAGMEGTAILAQEFREALVKGGVGPEILERAEGFLDRLSVVEVAMEMRDKALLMHDPTEGGVLGGIAEMSELIEERIEIFPENIPIAGPTERICNVLDVDPLRLIGSGALLAIFPEELKGQLCNEFSGFGLTLVGRVAKGAEELKINRDELWRLLEEREN